MDKPVAPHLPKPDLSLIQPVPIDNQWIELKWFIALVRPTRVVPRQQREDVKALEAMQAMGIPAWYPTGKRRQIKSGPDGKRRMQTYLLFPGYLFVAHVPDFARILNIRHITGMLGYETGGSYVPSRVPGYAMQALFAGEEIRQRRIDVESEPLKSGESVSVIDGPFAHFDGQVNRLINAERIEIVLEILGSRRPVEISVDKLRRL